MPWLGLTRGTARSWTSPDGGWPVPSSAWASWVVGGGSDEDFMESVEQPARPRSNELVINTNTDP